MYAGLLFASLQDRRIRNDAGVVHIILGRRLRKTKGMVSTVQEHTAGEDVFPRTSFYMSCKRTSSARRQRSVSAVKTSAGSR